MALLANILACGMAVTQRYEDIQPVTLFPSISPYNVVTVSRFIDQAFYRILETYQRLAKIKK